MGSESGGGSELTLGEYTFPNTTSFELSMAIRARPKADLGSGSEATCLLGETKTLQ